MCVCALYLSRAAVPWGEDDTDVMRWHVPSGGFGVVVILLFVWFLLDPHIIQITPNMNK